jgi:DNA-binding response OmpR family regulator
VARQTHVLLVDEDLPVRQALGRALTVENFHVVSAGSGSEAVQRFGEQSIDVLLLDLNPQSERGWDTLRRLTALQPLLPVIIITARAGQLTSGSTARTVDAWMEKPLDIPVLIQVLNELASQTPDVRHRVVTRRTANGDRK